MIAYIDSSILLRLLLNQKGMFKEYSKIELPVSSLLLKTECLRTIERLKLTGVLDETSYYTVTQQLHESALSFEFIKISQSILGRAGAPMPGPLGTLDAIHLASALVWSEIKGTMPIFLTHDTQLGKAALAMGFKVYGI